MQIRELLDGDLDPVESWPTGLQVLDDLVGGFTLGQLWVITGSPGAGKTTLLTQMVHRLAVTFGFAVYFQPAGSDRTEEVRARLLSLATGRPRAVANQPPREVELSGLRQEELSALRGADLHVGIGGGWSTNMPQEVATPACLAIDEPEFNRPPVLAREAREDLRLFADNSGLVLVTAPRSHCLEASPHGGRLREEWASVADVMVEIESTSEPGGAVLRVLRNRRGPTGVVPVVQQSHVARFVERAPSRRH